MCAISVRN